MEITNHVPGPHDPHFPWCPDLTAVCPHCGAWKASPPTPVYPIFPTPVYPQPWWQAPITTTPGPVWTVNNTTHF